MKVSYQSLKDMWEDFKSAYPDTTVNLAHTKIYQVKRINDTKAILYETDVRTGSQKKVSSNLNQDFAEEIERASIFYHIDGVNYIPTDEVRNRVICDYFKNPDIQDYDKEQEKMHMAVTAFSSAKDAKMLAKAFQNVQNIIFTSSKPKNGYAILTGIRSNNSLHYMTVMDIIDKLKEEMPNITFLTDYPEQTKCGIDFECICQIPDMLSREKYPLYVRFYDNVSSRKSLQIDILVKINRRFYVLEAEEIPHRTSTEAPAITALVLDMLKRNAEKNLILEHSLDDVKIACCKYMPKKLQKEFNELLVNAENSNLLFAAYDAMEEVFYCAKRKETPYKTQNYDAGKRKCQVELGSLLTKN